MSINRNKINIDSLTEQLENIVEEYNNIDFDITLNQPSVVSLENKLSSLNQENQFLENEIKLLKNYLSYKIESLNNENKFDNIFNKFLEYFKSGKYSSKELMKKFSQYVEKEFSGELINTIDFNNLNNLSSKENLSIEKIEQAFEIALDEIRKIQSSKNSFINKIVSENALSYSSTDKILHNVFEHLDGIENKLFSQIQKVFYEQKDVLANSYQLENFNILKNNVLNVISDNINNLKNEFINFVSFNKYLDKKIDNFRHTAPEFSDTLGQTFKPESNDDKFENLEAKVNTLINVINDLKNNDNIENFDQIIRTTTNNMVEEKFLALENKLTKLIKDLDEKNSKILENQNTSKNDVDVEKLINTIKTSITEENKNFISKIIENNLNEKKDILSLLKRIQKQSEQKSNDYEMENKQAKNSQKLLELEDLILRQNDEIENLLREKNDALYEIENILNSQQKKAITQETLDSIQKSIVDIADSFNSKINYLETSLATKLDDLNLSANISDEISRNIGNVENRLLQNYENIKTNFNINLEEIKNKLDDTTTTDDLKFKMNDILSVVTDVKDSNNYANIERILDTKTSEVIDKKIIELETKFNEVLNMMNENNKNSIAEDRKETKKLISNFEEILETLKQEKNDLIESVNINNEKILSRTEHESQLILNQFNKFLSDLKAEKEQSKHEYESLINAVITNNQNEKRQIMKLIDKLEKEGSGLDSQRAIENSKKLTQLEYLILRQNDELESLLNEKELTLDALEKVLTSKHDNVNLIDNIQASIYQISDEFNEKISELEKNFAEKLDGLNLNSSNLSDEMSKNIANIENRLLQNYETIKNSFNASIEEIQNNLDNSELVESLKFKMNDILSVVNDVKDSNNYANIERILDSKTSEVLDKKIIELEVKINDLIRSIAEDNRNMMSEDKIETKKLINNFEEILESIRKEKEELVESIALNNQKIFNKTETESKAIIERMDNFLDYLKNQKEESEIRNQELITSLISSNENEKKQILKLIKKLEDERDIENEQEFLRSIENSKKLTQLEYLILKQNDEFELLLDEKQKAIEQLEQTLNEFNGKSRNEETFNRIEASIRTISDDFEDKINALEKTFSAKLEDLNIQSSISSELSRNIQSIENRLLDNYEKLRNNFNSEMELIKNNLDNEERIEKLQNKINDIITKVDDVKETNNFANIERILNTTTSEVMDQKIVELEEKFNEVINVINRNNEHQTEQGREYHKQLVNSFEDIVTSLKRDKEEFIDSINTNNENIIRKSQEESRQLLERMENLIEALKIEKEESKIEHQNFFSNIVMNNENEKKYIISLLKKVEDNVLTNGGLNQQRAIENNRKLVELDYLILKQNDEIESLLADKQDALETIEKLIHENRKEILNSATLDHVRDSILDIAQTFEVRINNLEESFNREFRKINIKSLGEQLNSDRENINSNINNLENKLISNYEQIKDNINESFESILSSINSNGKDNNSLYELTNLIDRKFDKLEYLYKDIDSKNELFKNEIVERIQDFANRSSDSNALNEGLNKIEKMLNNSLINIQEAAENSYEKIDTKISKIGNTTDSIVSELKQHQTVFDNLSSKLLNNFDKYEELLIKSLDKDRRNYEELKLIISEHFHKKEQQLNEAELAKLESLNKKLDNLVDLIDLQEQEINSLVQEKDEVIKKLNSSLKKNDFTTDEIENISSIIEEKINLCLKRILESPDNISNFFLSNNHQNEFAQVNDKIDELSKYVHDNIEIHKNNSSFKDLVKMESFKDAHNLDFVFDKLTNIQKDLLNILKTDIESLDKDGIVKIQKDISAFKFNLLNIENDVILLKTKINSNVISENYVNENDFKEILQINNKKISMIEDLIEKNNTILSDLSIEKEKILSKTEKDLSANFNINDNDNLEIILEAKANTVIDKMIDEIKKTQSEEISKIESRFQQLENKLDAKQNNNLLDGELKNKINSIEDMISNSFKSLAKVNEDLVNYLDERLNENNDSFNQIVKKFEEGRQEIKNEIIAQSNALKKQMALLNNDEIELYKSELQNYSNKLKKAQAEISELEAKYQNSNNEILDKDRIILGQEFRLEHIEELIDNLSLQIDSFVEEKNELINLMSDKLDYLGKLEAPEKDEFIELESDNLETNKFQKIIVDETSNMIQEKFKELRSNFEDYANEIKLTFEAINKEQNELTNNQITNKKENDENILTIEKRLKNIEKFIFKNESKNSNSNDNNLELQKINQYDDNTLKLLNDNILFYVDELERRKKEIEIFYKKIRSLKNYLDKESN